MDTIKCQGVLIDMDGVLVDSTPAVARVWSRWAAKYNLDGDAVVKRAHGRTSLTTIRELLPEESPEMHENENRWMEQAEIEDIADVFALPGAKELLGALPADRFAVVTSATHRLAEVRLRAAGLWDLVKNMVSSSDIQHGKPHPEPYLKGAAKLGLPAQDCVVIEDASSGTRSGKAAGARVIAVRTTTPDEELVAAKADWIVNDCASIRVVPGSGDGGLDLELRDDSGARRAPKMA
ncbi:MAG TPA: HAD-IA family hydrolase [Candidatus Acidoferrum sp.]|jgi:sugar-phosphatase